MPNLFTQGSSGLQRLHATYGTFPNHTPSLEGLAFPFFPLQQHDRGCRTRTCHGCDKDRNAGHVAQRYILIVDGESSSSARAATACCNTQAPQARAVEAQQRLQGHGYLHINGSEWCG